MEKAQCVLSYFEPYLGRIEIMGSAGRIERVYFEIKQSHIDQWEKPQIKVGWADRIFGSVRLLISGSQTVKQAKSLIEGGDL